MFYFRSDRQPNVSDADRAFGIVVRLSSDTADRMNASPRTGGSFAELMSLLHYFQFGLIPLNYQNQSIHLRFNLHDRS